MGEGSGISVADALALKNSGNNNGNQDGFLGGGQGAWWVIILILFFAFAGFGRNNGNSGNGGGNGTNTVVIPANMGFGGSNGGYNACCTPATQQSLTDAFNFNQLDNGVRGLERGLCDGFYNASLMTANLGTQMQQGFCSTDRANLQSFNALGNAVNGVSSVVRDGFNGVQSAIAQTNYNMKDCCCGTEKLIMQAGYNNQANFNSVANQLSSCCCDLKAGQKDIAYALAQQTCDIINNNDKNTDRIINHLVQTEMDSLRNELQTAQFQLSQQAQTRTLIDQILPVAKPAYITCSPYASSYGFGAGYGPYASNCNVGCNCNNGCC